MSDPDETGIVVDDSDVTHEVKDEDAEDRIGADVAFDLGADAEGGL